MTKGIEAIVGLGNPGPDYEPSRHNAGFWFVDTLAPAGSLRRESRFQGLLGSTEIAGRRCWLLEPQTFMNRSGASVAALLKYYRIPIDRLLVVHDDIDLPPGTVRLKTGGGHGGHNGLRDIIAALGGERGFHRLRIGVGHPGDRRQVVDYVLHRPSKADREAIDRALDAAHVVLPLVVEGRLEAAMQRLHTAG